MNSPALPDAVRTRADLDALLASATNYEERAPAGPRAFDLGRMRALLASVGDPHRGPRVVHVAGSKGKGSVCRMADAILREGAKEPVGLYTSPHLEDLAERVAIDGDPAGDDELARAADRLLPHVRATRGTDEAPTFFEVLTAAAWLVFRERACADVVLEVGLGGRLDATNVCEPAATVITTIELEHVRVLGDTVEKIAAEKAGILKPRVPCVTTAIGAALGVIRARAKEVGAPLAVVGESVRVLSAATGPGPETRARIAFADGEWEVAMPVAGAHHATNAAAACAAARLLHVPERRIRRALRGLRLPGVVEPVGADPVVVADGAHTPTSAARTREAVEACWPGRETTLVLAAMEDKDVAGIARALAPLARRAFATSVASPRALPAEAVARALRGAGVVDTVAVPSPAQALARAREAAGPSGLVLATGSVYLAGAARQTMRSVPS